MLYFKMNRKYMDENAGDSTDGGKGAGGAGDADEATAAAAQKADEDAAAAKKVDDDTAAKAKADNPELAKLQEDNANLLKEVMKRKGDNKDLSASVETLQAQAKQFEGIDLEEVKALIAGKKDAETQALEKKGEWDTLKTQLIEAHEATVTELNAKLEELKSANAGSDLKIQDMTIGRSFNESKFIGDKLVLPASKARVLYGDHFEIENGNVIGYNKPRGQEGRAQLIDGQGEPLAFEGAIQKIIDADSDRDNLMKAVGKPGAGSKPAEDVSKGVAAPVLTGRDRIKAGLAAKPGT